jgi:hypothetical protein
MCERYPTKLREGRRHRGHGVRVMKPRIAARRFIAEWLTKARDANPRASPQPLHRRHVSVHGARTRHCAVPLTQVTLPRRHQTHGR